MTADELYRRGRNDFIESVAASLSDPEIQDMGMTVGQFLRVLKECGHKCDQVTLMPPK